MASKNKSGIMSRSFHQRHRDSHHNKSSREILAIAKINLEKVDKLTKEKNELMKENEELSERIKAISNKVSDLISDL